MDVKILACTPCYPRRRTAMKLAKTINEELGIGAPIESGLETMAGARPVFFDALTVRNHRGGSCEPGLPTNPGRHQS